MMTIEAMVEQLKAEGYKVINDNVVIKDGFILVATLEEIAQNRINGMKAKAAYEKKEAEKAAQGIIRVSYYEYKNNYSTCETVDGSYDKKTKTIEVITKPVAPKNGLCPHCGTYCYGDCRA